MVLRGIWAKCLLYWIGVWSQIGGGPLTDSAMIGLAARIVLSQTHEVLNTDSSWSPGFTNIYTQLENVTVLRWNSYSHTFNQCYVGCNHIYCKKRHFFAPLDDITTRDWKVMIHKVETELIMVEILRGGVFLVVPEVSSQWLRCWWWLCRHGGGGDGDSFPAVASPSNGHCSGGLLPPPTAHIELLPYYGVV